MRCGLEVEFHIYRIRPRSVVRNWIRRPPPGLGLPPDLELIHPGYNLLAEAWWDMADEPLRIVQQTGSGAGTAAVFSRGGIGARQVEAVFEADRCVDRCRQHGPVPGCGVGEQALQRAGYYATFVCRPPFRNIMSSGWHLHQSLDRSRRRWATPSVAHAPASGTTARSMQAAGPLRPRRSTTSPACWQHARGMAVLCTPTANGFARFQPNALAPQVGPVGTRQSGRRVPGGSAPGGDSGPPGSRIASASRRPTRTCTWHRRSTPAWTASNAA